MSAGDRAVLLIHPETHIDAVRNALAVADHQRRAIVSPLPRGRHRAQRLRTVRRKQQSSLSLPERRHRYRGASQNSRRSSGRRPVHVSGAASSGDRVGTGNSPPRRHPYPGHRRRPRIFREFHCESRPPDHSLRADAAQWRTDRRHQRHANLFSPLHRPADRVAEDICRSGGHRHQQCRPLQRDPGSAEAADCDRRNPEGDRELADRRAARVRGDRRECEPSAPRPLDGRVSLRQWACLPRSLNADAKGGRRRAEGVVFSTDLQLDAILGGCRPASRFRSSTPKPTSRKTSATSRDCSACAACCGRR